MDNRKSENKNIEFLKIAGACSLVQSLLYIIAVAALSRTPMLELLDQDHDRSMEIFLTSFSANPFPVTVMCTAFVFLGLLGFIAVAPATGIFLKEDEYGWLKIGKNIGLLSLAIIIVYYAWFLSVIPEKVAVYSNGDSVIKSMMVLAWSPREPSDWISWFLFGGMGIWVATVGLTVYQNKLLSRSFVVICAVKTGGFWIANAGIILGNASIAVAGAIIGGLIGGPLYHAWLGFAMRRSAIHEYI